MSLLSQYTDMLKQLLPTGSAWNKEEGSTLSNLLESVAGELAHAHGRVEALNTESKAHLTAEMLDNWETETGLPTPCTKLVDQTFQQRRNAVVSKLAGRGGQSRAYFTQLAKGLGYDINIIEYRPFIAGVNAAGDHVNDAQARFIWKVQIHTDSTLQYFRAGSSTAGESLGGFSDGIIQCIFNQLKPAHTTLWFEEI